MRLDSSLLLWAVGGLALLLLMAAGVLAASGKAAKLRQVRLDQVIAPHRQALATAASMPRPGAAVAGRVTAWLAVMIGYQPARAALHPMRWWLVLLLAFPIARLVCGLLAALAGEVALLATPLVWLLIARSVFVGFERRRLELLYRQLPDALAMIVRAARVGIPVTEAIRTVAREAPQPTAQEFGDLADRLAIGLPLADALTLTARRSGVAEYGFFATALILQNQTGGALSETLDNLADVIRRRVALRARAHALASEARTSSLILVALPVVAALALAVISPDYIRLLYEDPGGQQIAALAIGMVGTGAFAMRTIISRSLG